MTKIMKGGIAYNSTANMVALTQVEYNALSTAQKNNGNFYFITDAEPSYFSAENIDYDNTSSGLAATNVQGAVDEVFDGKADKNNVINPPDFSTITRTALTDNVAVQVTSTGAWYAVRAINTNTSGTNFAFILDANNDQYLSASSNPAGTYLRAMTSWLYFPSGAKFYVRACFTYADDSGLLKAKCLSI